jgi:hypothetical protein
MKNSTFDFTNFKTCVNAHKDRANSRSKSREKHSKEIDAEIRAITNRTSGHKKLYYVPVTVTNRPKEGKSTRSNSRTKTVSIKKVNFIKNASPNLNVFRKMVSIRPTNMEQQRIKSGKRPKATSKNSERDLISKKYDLVTSDHLVKMLVKPKKHIKSKR